MSTFSWQRRKYIPKPVSCCRCYFGSQPQLIVWANYRPRSSGDPPCSQGRHPHLARACGLPVQAEQPRELFSVGLPTRRPWTVLHAPASSSILNRILNQNLISSLLHNLFWDQYNSLIDTSKLNINTDLRLKQHKAHHTYGSAAMLTRLCLFVTPWTVAHQAALSTEFIYQARILERVAISSSRGIFPTQGSNVSHVSCTADGFFTAEPSGKHI